jgi:hypothetical protein
MSLKRRIVAALATAAVLTIGPLAAQPAFAAKPCNGCVGNADTKSPGGQSDGDKNRGYECDSNHGVGRGNPAHTGDCEEVGGDT